LLQAGSEVQTIPVASAPDWPGSAGPSDCHPASDLLICEFLGLRAREQQVSLLGNAQGFCWTLGLYGEVHHCISVLFPFPRTSWCSFVQCRAYFLSTNHVSGVMLGVRTAEIIPQCCCGSQMGPLCLWETLDGVWRWFWLLCLAWGLLLASSGKEEKLLLLSLEN
jgi:hypothetical protein